MTLLEELFLAPDGLGRVVGNRVEHAALMSEGSQRVTRIPCEEGHLAGAFLTIASRQLARGRLVIAFEGLKRLVRNPILQRFQIEHTHERVTAADAVIKKGQWLVAG